MEKHFIKLTIKLAIAGFMVSFCPISMGLVHNFKAGDGSVNFLAKGKPALLKIEGKGDGFKGTLTEVDGKVSGSLTMEVKSFSTGIELRDEHMKNKYLEVAHFPLATLSLNSQTVPESGHFEFVGELEIKGVSKPIKGTATIKKVDGRTELTAEFPIKISNYPIGVPKYLGITVAETVQVSVISNSHTSSEGLHSESSSD